MANGSREWLFFLRIHSSWNVLVIEIHFMHVGGERHPMRATHFGNVFSSWFSRSSWLHKITEWMHSFGIGLDKVQCSIPASLHSLWNNFHWFTAFLAERKDSLVVGTFALCSLETPSCRCWYSPCWRSYHEYSYNLHKIALRLSKHFSAEVSPAQGSIFFIKTL